MRDMADADLLFPLREINSVEKQKEKLPEILKVLQGSLDKSPHKITGIKRTPFTIQFKIMIDGNYEEVDLLPIMDLKSKIGHRKFSRSNIRLFGITNKKRYLLMHNTLIQYVIICFFFFFFLNTTF